MEEAKTKTVAEVMTEAIESGGRDRAAVARAAGVAYSVIWQCSRGYYIPGKENAKKIATVLGLPESFLSLCEEEHERRIAARIFDTQKMEKKIPPKIHGIRQPHGPADNNVRYGGRMRQGDGNNTRKLLQHALSLP